MTASIRETRRIAITRKQRELARTIAQLHRQGKPLNISYVREHHPRLLELAYKQKPFLGWKQAVETAGLKYSEIRVVLPRAVRCKVCGARRLRLSAHLRRHHGMSVDDYRAAYGDVSLLSDAIAARKVKEESSLVPHWESVWTPEYALDRLNELHRAGVSLNPSNIERVEPSLYAWTRRFFGNWDVALQGIGLDPKAHRKASRKKNWTREALLSEVCRLKYAGHDVNWRSMLVLDRSVTWAAIKLFGSYDRMLRAAGFNPGTIRKLPVPPRKYKTEGDVINGICRRVLKEQPINQKGVATGAARDLSLYNKGRRLFGTWKAAIEAAGFAYHKVRQRTNPYVTAELVVDAIGKRREAGKPLTAKKTRLGADGDPQLYFKALEFFGTWPAAVGKVGVRYETLRPSRAKYRTREAVLAEIRRRHEKGLPLGGGVICHGKHSDIALCMRARRLFGRWDKAIEMAGIPYSTVKYATVMKYATREKLIAELKRRHGAGLPISSKQLTNGEHKDFSLASWGTRLFGSMRRAIEAAGIEYKTLTLGIRSGCGSKSKTEER